MLIFPASELKTVAASVFAAAGSSSEDAEIIADSLVGANLAGHDSHGIMRVPEYITWVKQGWVNLSSQPHVVQSAGSFAVLDGDWGWGQVIGRRAVEIVGDKASQEGVAAIFVRNSCHLGRVGEYPEKLAARGIASVIFVNTHGAGLFVAPWGGVDRRLSANPIGIGIPCSSGDPVVIDISTCSIAEGKLRNLLTAEQSAPPGYIVDAEGHPSTNPADFYGPPVGALLPFGGHKGFALSLAADILAGAFSGAGCSRPNATRIGNSFMLVAVDVEKVRGNSGFSKDVLGLIEYVKSSRLAEGTSEILVPGEPESRIRRQREKDGIPVHPATWEKITEVALSYGVKVSGGTRNVQ